MKFSKNDNFLKFLLKKYNIYWNQLKYWFKENVIGVLFKKYAPKKLSYLKNKKSIKVETRSSRIIEWVKESTPIIKVLKNAFTLFNIDTDNFLTKLKKVKKIGFVFYYVPRSKKAIRYLVVIFTIIFWVILILLLVFLIARKNINKGLKDSVHPFYMNWTIGKRPSGSFVDPVYKINVTSQLFYQTISNKKGITKTLSYSFGAVNINDSLPLNNTQNCKLLIYSTISFNSIIQSEKTGNHRYHHIISYGESSIHKNFQIPYHFTYLLKTKHKTKYITQVTNYISIFTQVYSKKIDGKPSLDISDFKYLFGYYDVVSKVKYTSNLYNF